MSTVPPTWELVLKVARQIGADRQPVSLDELVRGVQRLDPGRGRGSITPVIQGMTRNAPGGPPSACGEPLERAARGMYRLLPVGRDREVSAPVVEPAPAPSSGADVVLVGCVKTKFDRAAPARELYRSSLFQRRMEYAEKSGARWFVVSSRWGLVVPEEVIAPYDLYLPDLTPEYRAAWGRFVAQQLIQTIGSLSGRRVELHAGQVYVSALASALAEQGAVVVTPVVAGSMGETLAWYGRQSASGREADAQPAAAQTVDDLACRLRDPLTRRPVSELLASDPAVLAKPGLYSWWVDADGARDLSTGLATPVLSGLLYAGQAGATRYPSGRPSGNTLWARLVGMHLRGNAEFSTFRRTLLSALSGRVPQADDREAWLNQWMRAHLSVCPVPVPDSDALGRLERAVLAKLDPQLNLQHMTPSPVRERLTALRRR